MHCQKGDRVYRKKITRVSILFLAVLAVCLTTCTNNDSLYSQNKPGESARVAAFIGQVLPAAPVTDTAALIAIDTFHTFDTLAFIGVVMPSNAEVAAAWTFGDNDSGDGALLRHAYSAGGIYTAIFTIRDAAGYVLS